MKNCLTCRWEPRWDENRSGYCRKYFRMNLPANVECQVYRIQTCTTGLFIKSHFGIERIIDDCPAHRKKNTEASHA
jgi:hypothetical protein